MRNTIKAKVGYEVRHLKSKPDTVRVYDGDEFLFQGTLRTYEDYVDECVNGNDETAVRCEVFTTVKGNQFVYWRCEEYDEDYLTKIENQQKQPWDTFLLRKPKKEFYENLLHQRNRNTQQNCRSSSWKLRRSIA